MDIHFNGYKIRYQLLDHFYAPIKNSQHITAINFFINLDDIFHTLHRPLVDREFQTCGKNAARQLVSNVFNVIGHYRNWAIKQHIYPRVFVYYSSATTRFRNNIHVPNYRKHFFEINNPSNGNFYFINDAVKKAQPIFHVIAKYIEDVYMIDTKHLEPAIFPMYMISQVDPKTKGPINSPKTWNIVVSRDTYDLQYCYRDKWSMISPKGDNSLLITRKTMWEYLAARERVFKDPQSLHWAPDLYVVSKAIVGERYRNIPRLKSVGWKTLFKYMDEVQSEDILPEIVSLQQERMAELLTNRNVSLDALNHNISTISVDHQVAGMLETDGVMLLAQLEEMQDYATLAQINNDLFHDYPLNLQMLCNRPTLLPQWE